MHQANDTNTTIRPNILDAEAELMRIEGAAKTLCVLATNDENGDSTLDSALYYIATQIEEHCKELRNRMFPGKAVRS